MQIKAEDLVKMLKKMDEVEEKAKIAADRRDVEDLYEAVAKMRELRSMLYSALAKEEEAQTIPYPVTYPVVVPYREVPWWEQVTYKSTSGKSWDSGMSSSATGAE